MALLPQAILQLSKPNDDGLMVPLAYGVAYFYETGGTTPLAVYQDSAFGVAHGTYVVADADGKWPAIWLNPALGATRMKVIEAGGDLINPFLDIDPLDVFLGLGGVTNEYLADAPAGTLKGNLTGGDGPVDDYAQDDVTDFLRVATDSDTGVVEFATDAETIAGASNSLATTPSGVDAAIDAKIAAGPTTDFAYTFTIGNPGNYVHPGGLMEQWFTATVADDALTVVDLAYPFDTACLSVQVSVKNNSAHTGGNGGGAFWYPVSNTQIKVGIAWDGTSTGITDVEVWAKGY